MRLSTRALPIVLVAILAFLSAACVGGPEGSVLRPVGPPPVPPALAAAGKPVPTPVPLAVEPPPAPTPLATPRSAPAFATESEPSATITSGSPLATDSPLTPPTATGAASSSPAATAMAEAAAPQSDAAPRGGEKPAASVGDMRLEVTGRGEVVARQAVLAKPGERLEFRATLAQTAKAALAPGATKGGIRSTRQFFVEVSGGAFEPTVEGGIAWTAPEQPGRHTLKFRLSETAAPATASGAAAAGAQTVEAARETVVLVQYPFDRAGRGDLDGYPVGIYPSETGPDATSAVSRKPEAFTPPQWFVRVTPETEGLLLGPHFTLGEFSPSSERGQTHFVAVQQRLVDFLEALRAQAITDFGPAARIVILRAYMSPNEHRRLEQKGIRYSLFTRYQYGDSAAIVLDSDGDKMLDDLNKDGTVDQADAEALAALIDRVQTATKTYGWLGTFAKPIEPDWPQTPFVTFDLRGIKMR